MTSTLTAGSVIEQARERHAAFDTSRHPNKVVLAFLSGYVRQLQGKVARIDPDALRSDITAALPLANHEAGIALGSNRLVVEAVSFDDSGAAYPIEIIPPTQRLDRGIKIASAWQIGETLFLTSPASLWQRMVSVAVAIVGLPARLTTLQSIIPLPDQAETALVEKVAYFMAKRLPTDPKATPINMGAFKEACDDAEMSYLTDVTNRLSGMVIRTRDVYDP